MSSMSSCEDTSGALEFNVVHLLRALLLRELFQNNLIIYEVRNPSKFVRILMHSILILPAYCSLRLKITGQK